MLTACIESLLRQCNIGQTSLHLVVVDNDTAPSSVGVVQKLSESCGFPVHYHHEPRRGIPMARNRVLQEAAKLGADWLAFLDDDQVAAPDWIEKSLYVAGRDKADVVRARQIMAAPEDTPFWWYEGKNDAMGSPEDGPVEARLLRKTATSGVLMSARLFNSRGLGLRFDERLALAGQEDGEFFGAASRAGARIVRSNLPSVTCAFHASRYGYSRYVLRGLAQGSARASQYRHANGFWKTLAKYGVIAVLRAFRGTLQLLTCPLFLPFGLARFKRTALEGGRDLFFTAGITLGLFLVQYGYYLQIDGS